VRACDRDLNGAPQSLLALDLGEVSAGLVVDPVGGPVGRGPAGQGSQFDLAGKETIGLVEVCTG